MRARILRTGAADVACRLAPLVLLLGMLGASACDTSTVPEEPAPVRSVILFIGDGMGAAAIEFTGSLYDGLVLGTLTPDGWLRTSSASHDVTDSGAAATALATGAATYNGAIGVDADGIPVETVIEAAERRGMSTGVVATSSVTHATPAAFTAHVADRGQEYEIALQQALSDIDVLLGGGRQFFAPPARPDGLDLVGPFLRRGCELWELPEDVRVDVPPPPCVLGLFEAGALPRAPDRTPTLEQLTTAALHVLSTDPDGFFLLVEGSLIDWAGHENDAAWLADEVLSLDAAVGAALRFWSQHPDAMILLTADHETGGLTVNAPADTTVVEWTTTGHTAVDVPYFVIGGPQAWTGPLANHEFGALLLELVRGSGSL